MISRRGSFDLIDYPGKNDDADGAPAPDDHHQAYDGGGENDSDREETPSHRYDAADNARREHAFDH